MMHWMKARGDILISRSNGFNLSLPTWMTLVTTVLREARMVPNRVNNNPAEVQP